MSDSIKTLADGTEHQSKSVAFEGLEVSLYRSNGRLVVDIDTSELEKADVHAPHDIPNIRLRLNEQGMDIEADGTVTDVE